MTELVIFFWPVPTVQAAETVPVSRGDIVELEAKLIDLFVGGIRHFSELLEKPFIFVLEILDLRLQYVLFLLVLSYFCLELKNSGVESICKKSIVFNCQI